MNELKVYYFKTQAGWWVGINREGFENDGVFVSDALKYEKDAINLATKVGCDLMLPVERLDVMSEDVDMEDINWKSRSRRLN